MDGHDVEFRVAEPSDELARATIEQGLIAYNREHGGESAGRALAVTVHDRQTGVPIGGLQGRTSYGLLYIELLFLPPRLRRKGIGAAVMRIAEAEAVQRGCTMAMLFTFDFQAPGFYARLGFEEFGRVEPKPPGRTRIYMRKYIGTRAAPA